MKRTSLWLVAAILAIAAGGVGLVWLQLQARFGPGNTVEETAQILVHDLKFGARAKQKAIEYGDDILPLIKKESNDFQELNGRNAFWIAEVLGAIRTQKSRSVLNDLYYRTDTVAKLTAAVGLAQHGALPDPIDEQSFLIQTVRNDPGQTETHLAIIALGKTKDPKALPCLLDLLGRRPMDYWHHAYACEALARIGSPDAIPVLRDCLKSDQFDALPAAFRACVSLGDREAVPLAIARVSPELKRYNSGFVVEELTKVTGKSYGYNRKKWEKWWASVEGCWHIPEEFEQPWDEQEHSY